MSRWRVTVSFSFDRVYYRDVIVDAAGRGDARKQARAVFAGKGYRVVDVQPCAGDEPLGKGAAYERYGVQA